ncbi:sugar phosphate isomerase/epimerase family protein [Rhizohabitans arisaemae]|uniref:sugar phosphate isomerase/epimerase family protein n=1 Tax=Rhizohabitans arisaemae TaxID=2720610 RepID=UPI0024B05E5C|nr:sugar phosphate isomerase/epimerase family protein [Rhizohabitans arisaemae]
MYAFVTANFIGRELGYSLPGWRVDDPVHPFLGGWDTCAAAVREAFSPEETYRERLGALLGPVRAAGFETIEFWSGHLNPLWATDRQIGVAREVVDGLGLRVVGFSGYIGASREYAERTCRIAAALGTPLLTGGGGAFFREERAAALGLLDRYGLRLAIENHPEHPTPEVLLAEVGGDAELVGVNLDTGWWATHGYDGVKAVGELGDRLFHVQLKDVAAVGTHHPTPFGTGVVPVQEVLDALDGYSGAISLEYLAADTDPIPPCRDFLSRAQGR